MSLQSRFSTCQNYSTLSINVIRGKTKKLIPSGATWHKQGSPRKKTNVAGGCFRYGMGCGYISVQFLRNSMKIEKRNLYMCNSMNENKDDKTMFVFSWQHRRVNTIECPKQSCMIAFFFSFTFSFFRQPQWSGEKVTFLFFC